MTEPDLQPASDVPSLRLPNGRFAHGNRGGPGNPLARRVAAYRRAILESATPAQAASLMREVYSLAMDIDAAPRDRISAATLWLQYCAGKPAAVADDEKNDERPQLVFVFSDGATEARRIVENARRRE